MYSVKCNYYAQASSSIGIQFIQRDEDKSIISENAPVPITPLKNKFGEWGAGEEGRENGGSHFVS